MSINDIIGAIGSGTILVAYLMLRFSYSKSTDLNYLLVNLTGSILLIIYAYLIGSIVFIVLNIIWAIVSLKDIVLRKNS